MTNGTLALITFAVLLPVSALIGGVITYFVARKEEVDFGITICLGVIFAAAIWALLLLCTVIFTEDSRNALAVDQKASQLNTELTRTLDQATEAQETYFDRTGKYATKPVDLYDISPSVAKSKQLTFERNTSGKIVLINVTGSKMVDRRIGTVHVDGQLILKPGVPVPEPTFQQQLKK